MVGGFGMTGAPVHLLHALAETETDALTVISNNVGEVGLGGGRLLQNGQLRAAIGSFYTSNPEAVKAATEGRLRVTLLPQGTLAEAIRAGGAGIGGFYTPTAAGTQLAGADVRTFDGVEQVFVEGLRADVALVRAWKADRAGNLTYRRTERNFNPLMATAADHVIVEAEHIVEVGELGPDEIHTPGLFVDALVHAHTTVEELGSSGKPAAPRKDVKPARRAIARRAFEELRRGDIVNLGVGIPTLVADFIEAEHGIVLHTENGMVGVGPTPIGGNAMDFPVNAGKLPVSVLPGASYFDSATSFGMIRGGHVDVAIMGGLQVDQEGSLANWAVPGRPLLGVGGAMDLAANAKRLIITMTHVTRDGASKVVEALTLPVTAHHKVHTLITDRAVFQWPEGRMTLVGLLGEWTLEDVRESTGATFEVGLG